MNQSVTIDVNKATAVTVSSPVKIWQQRLTLILFVQLLLIVGIFAYKKNTQLNVDAQPLLGTAISEVDRIIIRDANSSVVLQKSASGWQLPELQQLPVDQQKLDDILQKLEGTKLTWPVTTTPVSHERFEVTDNKFQRRIELFIGDTKKADILLGSSPGFKKVHLRKESDDNVYAVELTTFEFATNATEWLQKSLLAVKDPTMIKAADYHLQKNGDQWSFVVPADSTSEKIAAEKLNELTNAVANLQIQTAEVQAPEGGERTTIVVASSAGEFTFEFVKAGDAFFVKRNDNNRYFKISQYEYERIANIKKAALVDSTPEVSGVPDASDPVADMTSLDKVLKK
ncbi:DUF4340 domain-containing protein [Cellvibrio sp. UBA7661]|uniref:DUF4340 domain-containing protein n=1 Tax=Cellvibrio sp. UBA7661 TaxID=1946311 RepID=UPI002F35B93E